MSSLQIRNLSKSFGGNQAVDNVSFDLKSGEILALIGPNGAGKSTCFNMINGMVPADTGSVMLNGCELIGMKPRKIWRLGVGRTFQITAVYASMSVVENVQMALISHHKKAFSCLYRAARLYRNEALHLLELIGMADQADRATSILAYGDLKRLELAVALANQPTLLLMDEPTAGMAPGERRALMRLTGDIVAKQDVSILFTEHDMDVVFENAHRVLVLNRGSLLAEGLVDEVRSNPAVQEVYLGGGTTFADGGISIA